LLALREEKFMYGQFLDTLYFADDYRGRSTRKEFWTWKLVAVAWIVLTSAVLSTIGAIINRPGFISGISVLVIYIAAADLAITFRRMHDVGKSGWWGLVPFYGLFFKPSTKSQ
jgi:uncharacterized membrane protein YhaH (DUF805 family)